MGSAESSGALHISLDQRNLQAGECLTGVVHLLVTRSTQASQLALYFKGKEKTKWSVSRKAKNLASGDSHYETHNYKGRKDVVRHRFPIFLFAEQTLQGGQYSFPFSIRTPSDLPSTFEYRPVYDSYSDPGPTSATISYQLEARVEGYDTRIESVKERIHLTKPAPLPSPSLPSNTKAQITTWCCLRKGHVDMKVEFSKPTYTPGETALVTIEANNSSSTVEGLGISLSLTRTIRLRDTTVHSFTANTVVSEATVRERVLCGEDGAAGVRKTLRLVIPAEEGLASTTSVQGRLIECDYSLSSELLLDGDCMCCGELPVVTTPMVITPPSLDRTAAPEVPMGWDPTVMATAQFVATAGDSVTP